MIFSPFVDVVSSCSTGAINSVAVTLFRHSNGMQYLKAVGFDSALMASPIVTTIVDAGSLTVYFAVAGRVMSV